MFLIIIQYIITDEIENPSFTFNMSNLTQLVYTVHVVHPPHANNVKAIVIHKDQMFY